MKVLKIKLAYIAAFLLMGSVFLGNAGATPFASRIHDEGIVAGPLQETPLTKEEKKVLKKQKRAERKAAKTALRAEQASNSGKHDQTALPGWRRVFIPGYGYQTVYVDAFGYPLYDVFGRSLYSGFSRYPYAYRRYSRRVIRSCPAY